MTILYTCYVNLGEASGGVRHIFEIAEHLKRTGHEVVLFAPKLDPYPFDTPMEIIYVPVLRMAHLAPLSYTLMSFLHIARYLSKRGASLIYEREIDLSLTSSLVSWLFGIPLVIEVNAIITEEHELARSSAVKIKLMETMQGIYLKRANRIVAVTEGIKRELCEQFSLPPQKMIVVHNGTNLEVAQPREKSSCKKALGMDPSKPCVGFVGRLYSFQGVDYLIKAAPYVLEKMPHTMFLIVGDGAERENLEKLAESEDVADRFLFFGEVPFQKVPDFIGACDVCLALKRPLRSGYSPLKLYEYMACGRPVVASNLDGFEILSEHEAGCLVEPTDFQGTARQIVDLLKDEELQKRMGINGRKTSSDFSWETAARKVERMCQELVRERKRGFCYSE
jgi:glycosyltransferase involved in cell wall biosynthesis